MKTTKRLLGLLLAIVMVVGMLPLSVFAEAEVTEKAGAISTIGKTGNLVGMPEGVTPTYLSNLYNTDAKKYNYVTPNEGSSEPRDFGLDQNFFGNKVYVFTTASDSNRYAVIKGNASMTDAAGNSDKTKGEYRTLSNNVQYHISDIALGRNGTKYEKGLSFQPSSASASEHATVIFDISDLNADYFYAVAGMTGEGNKAVYSDRKINFEVYGSKDTTYGADMTFERLAYCNSIRAYLVGEFNVPITGYNYLKLVAVGVGSNTKDAESAWGTAAVYSVHDWQSEITTAATCTADGVMTYTCANADCGETYTKAIPVTGHSYETVVVDPTCTAVGSKTQTCSACGDVITEEIPTIDHSYGEYVDNGDGTETATCETCGNTHTREKAFEYWTPDENAENFAWLGDAKFTSANGGQGSGTAANKAYGGSAAIVIVDGNASLNEESGYWTTTGTEFTKGLGVHPQKSEAGYTEFDLTELDLDVDTFYSAFGYTNRQEFANKALNFSVLVKLEGAKEYTTLYTSEDVKRGDFNEITVIIPENAVALRLEVSSVGSYESQASAWANACVFKAHNFAVTSTVPATCTEDGKIIYTCADENCGETYDVEIPATGHSFTNYVVSGNYKTAECENGCGEKDTQPVIFDAVDVENVAGSITYLSDIYNTDAQLGHYENPNKDQNWALDENHDTHLYVYYSEDETSRRVIPENENAGDTRTLENGVTYHRDNIALGAGGTIYTKGLSVRPTAVGDADAYVAYDISDLNADYFYAVVGMLGEGNNYKYTDRLVNFELWAKVNAEDEFTKLYSVDGIRSLNTGVFNVDISGYNYIKLVAATAGTSDGGSTVAWGDACVYSLASEIDCDHVWGEGEITTAATCVSAGVMTYTCSECGNTKTVSIMPAGEHSYKSEQTKAPSCNEPGEMTYTCSACGHTYTEEIDPTGEHSYENGKCTVCDAADPSYTGSITLATATLNLQDKVCTIYKATDDQIATNNANVKERGVLLYDSAEKAATKELADAYERIVLEENGTVEDKVAYVGQSEGIDARDMDKTQYAVAYVKLTDGTYIYGTKNGEEQIVEYSPLIYCKNAMNSEDEAITAEVKNLCYAMMQYGAAAQKVQYNMTSGLMSEGFEAPEGVAYNESMLGNTVFSANTRTVGGMKLRSVTMALKGAISYIVKFSVDDSLSEEKLYAEYTLLGETGSVELTYDEGSKLWLATISGIAPKDLGETLTVKPYYLDENEKEVYGGELVFSGYEYTRIVTKNTNYDEKIKDLAKALAMYVYYADAYGNP